MNKLIAAVTVLAVSTAQADTIYVDASCPGGDGSELDPYCSIQTAIDNAVGTDEVVVAPGTYFETIDFLGKAITVRSSDGPVTTTIDAGGLDTVVRFINLEDDTTVLDGFTIREGNAVEGGGMLIEFSDPVVIDCEFTANDATRGAALFLVGSTATFTGCTFSDNSATQNAGAVYSNASSASFTACAFQSNSTTSNSSSHGGAMYNTNFSNSLMSNCTFMSNSALGDGGAVANTAFSDVVFDGCLFDNNWGNDGGAMYNSSSSPTITNCMFINHSPTGSGRGGAVYSVSDSNPSFLSCEFTANETVVGQALGGAIYSSGGFSTFVDCTFFGNFAADTTGGSNSNGGAIYCTNSTLTLTSCHLEGNVADATTSGNSNRGLGGALFASDSVITISSAVFMENEARAGVTGTGHGLGGAIYIDSNTVLSVQDSTFLANVADNGPGSGTTRALGGALYVVPGSATSSTVANCTFAGNSADANGGAIYHYGSFTTAQTLRIERSTFSGNLGVLGSSIFNFGLRSGEVIIDCRFLGNVTGVSGGIYNDDSDPDITNCIFVGNSASSFGGSIFNFNNSDPTITNCTFTHNEAFTGAAIYNFDGDSSASVMNCVTWGNDNANGEDLDGNGPHTVSFSNIEGGFVGTGNIDTDPMFIDADGPDDVPGTDDDNVRLALGSPCIDTGSNGLIPGGVIVDLDGNDRITDGDGDNTEVVDMGAYESPAIIDCNGNGIPDDEDIAAGTSLDVNGSGIPDECECLADFNGNGGVEIDDFLSLLAAWGPCAACPQDLDGDGTVGINDFLALLANWGPCP